MTKNRLIFLFLLLLQAAVAVVAQNNYPTIVHKYNMSNGVSNDVVYAICQDDDACVWFATAEGVSKYNGSSFRSLDWNHLTSQFGICKVLKINYLNDKIYMATSSGFMVYDMKTDRLQKRMPEGLDDVTIKALTLSRDGNIWVGTYSGNGIYKYNVDDETFTPLQYELTDSRLISLYEDEDGFLFVGTHFGGLEIVDLRSGKMVSYLNNCTPNTGNQVEDIIEDSFGNIWLGTWDGAMIYDKKTRILSPVSNPTLSNSKINSMTEDKNGNMWVGTENGLFSFNIKEFLMSPDKLKIT